MQINADLQLENLSESNLYKTAIDEENLTDKSIFIKIMDDPRITIFGNFIRRTSIHELPQLFNVIKVDMSLVGNRPLPLYGQKCLRLTIGHRDL